MTPDKKKGLLAFGLAFLFGVGFFTAILTSAVPIAAAGGVALLCALGFLKSFNRGYALFFVEEGL